ncbi:MAG: HigA family addiction module antitoxin [Acidobacteriota bacterium]
MKRTILNGRRRRPTHPGALLREVVLPAAGISQAELARKVGVSRRVISELCQEKRALSVDMAYRLARVFNTSLESWLNMQIAVDVWDELEAHKREYDRIKPLNPEPGLIKPERSHQISFALDSEDPKRKTA